MLAFAAALHDALGVQHAKLLGEGGELGVARLGELRDAALAGVEAVQQPEARQIASRSEERRGALKRRVTHLRNVGVIGSVGAAVLCTPRCATVCHFNDC